MIKQIKATDYKTSTWSGGTTTQIVIHPETELYENRNFAYRISSATIDLEESDFTPLPKYKRFITPLDNKITLAHGKEQIALSPLEIHSFSGATQTKSMGKCTDFNLMIDNSLEGSLESLYVKDQIVIEAIKKTENIIIFSVKGMFKINEFLNKEKETLVISDFEGNLTLTSNEGASILIARVSLF